jgi:hypothetical protein
LPHLAEHKVAFYLLGGIGASSLGCLGVVEGHFDPVIASFVDAALPQCVFSKISVDNDRGREYAGAYQREVWILSRIVFAYV